MEAARLTVAGCQSWLSLICTAACMLPRRRSRAPLDLNAMQTSSAGVHNAASLLVTGWEQPKLPLSHSVLVADLTQEAGHTVDCGAAEQPWPAADAAAAAAADEAVAAPGQASAPASAPACGPSSAPASGPASGLTCVPACGQAPDPACGVVPAAAAGTAAGAEAPSCGEPAGKRWSGLVACGGAAILGGLPPAVADRLSTHVATQCWYSLQAEPSCMHTRSHHNSTCNQAGILHLLHMHTEEQPHAHQQPHRKAYLHEPLRLPQQLGWQMHNTEAAVHASRHCAGVLPRLRLHATTQHTQQVTSALRRCTCMLGCCCGCICGGCC